MARKRTTHSEFYCEWTVKLPLVKDEDQCSRKATYTVSLLGSQSAANIFYTCWQHVKKYRNKKFLEQTFGKGAKVEIRRIR